MALARGWRLLLALVARGCLRLSSSGVCRRLYLWAAAGAGWGVTLAAGVGCDVGVRVLHAADVRGAPLLALVRERRSPLALPSDGCWLLLALSAASRCFALA